MARRVSKNKGKGKVTAAIVILSIVVVMLIGGIIHMQQGASSGYKSSVDTSKETMRMMGGE